MLEDPLVDLVKHVWGDSKVDVGMRKPIPEWLVNAPRYILVHTGFVKLGIGIGGAFSVADYIRSPFLSACR